MRRGIVDWTLGAGLLLSSALGAQELEWVHNLSAARPYSLESLSNSDDVYIAGDFQGSQDFDPGPASAIRNATGSEAFIAKYRSSGLYRWAGHIESSGFSWVQDIVLDEQGNVYALGHFEGTADFDPGLDVTSMASPGRTASFILKLDTLGRFQWAKRLAGTGATLGKSIEMDQDGNLVIAGLFENTVDFDPGPATRNLTASGVDIFLARYTHDGAYLWAHRMNGAGHVLEPAAHVDGSRNIYLTGQFENSIDVRGATLTGFGLENIFLAKLDSSGNRLWTRVLSGAAGHSQSGVSRPLVVDGAGNSYLVGHFQSTLHLAPGHSVTSAGAYDVFLAKYNTLGVAQWIRSVGGAQNDFGHAVDWDGTGVYVGGTYYGQGDWDPGFGTRILSHAGGADIHFSRFSPQGNLHWAYGLGSAGIGPLAGDDQLFNLTAAGSGRIHINGHLGGQVDFNVGLGFHPAAGRGFAARYSQSVCVTPPDDLEAWYAMDSGGFSTVQDLAGHRNGVRVGAVQATGKVSGAFDFDGVNDYVFATDHPALDVGYGDFSIAAWIRTSSTTGSIVSKRYPSGTRRPGYQLWLSDDRLGFSMGDTGSRNMTTRSNLVPALSDGQWHFVAVTVDRSSTVGGRMYLDGQRIRTFNPRNVSGNLSNDERLEIGRNNSGSNHFNGLIDEVTLFDRSLGSSEIAEMWRADTYGLCKPGLSPAPLAATLDCVGAADGYACQVTTVGGSGGNGFTWSYFGDGDVFPSGDSAQVVFGSCSGGLNHITVTVTDSSGASVSAAQSLLCLGGFG